MFPGWNPKKCLLKQASLTENTKLELEWASLFSCDSARFDRNCTLMFTNWKNNCSFLNCLTIWLVFCFFLTNIHCQSLPIILWDIGLFIHWRMAVGVLRKQAVHWRHCPYLSICAATGPCWLDDLLSSPICTALFSRGIMLVIHIYNHFYSHFWKPFEILSQLFEEFHIHTERAKKMVEVLSTMGAIFQQKFI